MPSRSATDTDDSRLGRLLGVGWAVAIAAVYLFRYDAWALPLQWGRLARATWPTLAIGPAFGEFASQRLKDFGFLAALAATAWAVGALMVGRRCRKKDGFTAACALAAGLWAVAVAVLVIGLISVRQVSWVFLGLLGWLLPVPRAFLREAWNGRHADPDPEGEAAPSGRRPESRGWRARLRRAAFPVRLVVAGQQVSGSAGASPSRGPAAGEQGLWITGMQVVVGVALVLTLVGAFSPPFEYDALEYHLGAPAEYLRAGRIVFLPHNFYSNLPQLTEMLYLLALHGATDGAAKLIHWAMGAMTALAILSVAARLWGRRIAWTAAALFYCLPFVQDLSRTARIDLATTFYATLAFGSLLLWQRENEARNTPATSDRSPLAAGRCDTRAPGTASPELLWLSALAAGGAVATKWPAIAVVLLPALGWVIAKRRSIRPAVGYLLLAVAVVLPWLLKNWWLSGNPVYPLFSGLFPNPHWGPVQAALFAEKHAPQFDAAVWRQPFELVWHYSFMEPLASPLLLLAAPLILLVRPADPAARRAAGLFLAAFAGWFLLTFRPWRFLFPAFPLAALAGAYAVDWHRRGRVARWFVGGSLVVVMGGSLALSGLSVLVDTENPERMPPRRSFLQYALGSGSREDLVEHLGEGVFEPIVWMNHHLPPGSKVLYVGEARAYDSRYPVVGATAFDRHPLTKWSREAADAEALGQVLRRQGITDIYVNISELSRLQSHYGYLVNMDWSKFRNLLQHHARAIHRFGRSTVYELEDNGIDNPGSRW